MSTFLAAEMLHVYRQITGLQTFQPLVLTQKRQHADRFPFPQENLIELTRPPGLMREWRRFAARRLTHSPPTLFGSELRELEAHLRDRKVSIFHAYFGNSGPFLLPLLKSPTNPCPVVVSFHGADAGVDLDKPRHQVAMNEVFEHADAILARSEALLADLEKIGCPPDKLHLSRTGIPLEDWTFNADRQFPGDGSWRLVQAGRLIAKKSYDDSLRAFAKFRDLFPKATFQVIGEGELQSDLEALATELGIRESVEFSGFLDQAMLQKAYKDAHLFLHPSRTSDDGNREGVPNAMLEAMATGLPVVATDHGGIPEAVDHSESGLLVPENQPEAIFDALQKLAADAERWQQMSETAARHVSERFERGAQIAALEAIYDRILRSLPDLLPNEPSE